MASPAAAIAANLQVAGGQGPGVMAGLGSFLGGLNKMAVDWYNRIEGPGALSVPGAGTPATPTQRQPVIVAGMDWKTIALLAAAGFAVFVLMRR